MLVKSSAPKAVNGDSDNVDQINDTNYLNLKKHQESVKRGPWALVREHPASH